MSQVQNYFVGIGAQRSGTTWLARNFDRHPEIGMSPVKETHYWSSKYVVHQRNSVRGLQALKIRVRQLSKHCLKRPLEAPKWAISYAGMMAHRDASYRSFIELGRYGAVVAGEITPAYATLPKEGFEAIEKCLGKPKYLFLVRNPADRFISQIAHDAGSDKSILSARSVSELLARPDFALRSNYRNTYRTCLSVAGGERLLVLFYEDLFDTKIGQATFDRICRFLGVSSRAADFSFVANAREVPSDIPKREEIVAALSDDYRFFSDLFSGQVPQRWQDDLDCFERTSRERRTSRHPSEC